MRFGIANSALWATATTAASNGSVNAMHDSFTPLGGLVPMWLMQLGEVIFGGVGSGLYGMLLFVIVAGVHRRADGRTDAGVPGQEDRGPRDEDGLAGHPGAAAGACWSGTAGGRRRHRPAWPASQQSRRRTASARSCTPSPRPATTTAAPSPVSTPTRPSTTSTLGLAMLVRPATGWRSGARHRGLAGAQEARPARRRARCPTHTPLFVALLVGAVMLVGALTFFPALALGPIVEHLQLMPGTSEARTMTIETKRLSMFDPALDRRPAILDQFQKLDPRQSGSQPGDVRRRGR